MNCSAQNKGFINHVLEQLNLNKQQCKTELVAFKSLPNNSNETVVVIPEIVTESDNYLALNSHILITDTQTGKIKYQYFESAETNGWYSDALVLQAIVIDTAPYKVTNNSRAFGIRVTHRGSSRVNPFEQEVISLFVKEGRELNQILKNYTVSKYNGEWDMNCEGKFINQQKILIMTDEYTNGYCTILVKNTISTTINFIDEQGECDSEDSVIVKKQLLKYEDGIYK